MKKVIFWCDHCTSIISGKVFTREDFEKTHPAWVCDSYFSDRQWATETHFCCMECAQEYHKDTITDED